MHNTVYRHRGLFFVTQHNALDRKLIVITDVLSVSYVQLKLQALSLTSKGKSAVPLWSLGGVLISLSLAVEPVGG